MIRKQGSVRVQTSDRAPRVEFRRVREAWHRCEGDRWEAPRIHDWLAMHGADAVCDVIEALGERGIPITTENVDRDLVARAINARRAWGREQ